MLRSETFPVKKQLVAVVASSALIVTGIVAGVASPALGAPQSPVLRDITVGSENFIGESALTIHEKDSEQPRGESKNSGGYGSAIDGDPNTFWHTQWKNGSEGFPHVLDV